MSFYDDEEPPEDEEEEDEDLLCWMNRTERDDSEALGDWLLVVFWVGWIVMATVLRWGGK